MKFLDDIDAQISIDEIRILGSDAGDRKLRLRANLAMDDAIAKSLPPWAREGWRLMRDAAAEAAEIRFAQTVELHEIELHDGAYRGLCPVGVGPTQATDFSFRRLPNGKVSLRFRFTSEMTGMLWDFLFDTATKPVIARFTLAQMSLAGVMREGAK